ncbi:MAG TPA: hypothetical protein VIJ36_09640 [Thermoanaerobaculia bacterium]
MTEKLPVKRKLLAALVMTAGLATVISALGIPAAAKRAVPQGAACRADELKGAMLPLELGTPLNLGGPEKASCTLTGLRAMLGADNLFLISYSSLNFFLFLFLVGSGRLRPAFLWCSAGTLLSVVMLVGDALENRALYQWIDEARLAPGGPAFSMPPPSFLAVATNSKWIAIAVASLLCGVAYLLQRSRFLKPLIIPAVVCAGLVGLGVYRQDVDLIKYGMMSLTILWGFGLLHSIAVILQPSLPTLGPVAGTAEPSHG